MDEKQERTNKRSADETLLKTKREMLLEDEVKNYQNAILVIIFILIMLFIFGPSKYIGI